MYVIICEGEKRGERNITPRKDARRETYTTQKERECASVRFTLTSVRQTWFNLTGSLQTHSSIYLCPVARSNPDDVRDLTSLFHGKEGYATFPVCKVCFQFVCRILDTMSSVFSNPIDSCATKRSLVIVRISHHDPDCIRFSR